MKTKSRLMEVKLVVPEENVGGIIADLNGRFAGLSVGVIETVPFDRNKPGKKWSAARRKKFKNTLKKKGKRKERRKQKPEVE